VLENIIGVAPAPPPDEVPALSDEEHPNKPRSGREVLEQHRANQVCASCHRVLDPIGLALENYDAVGAWRTRDGGTLGEPIDASGQLVDGTKVDGVVALRQALVREPQMVRPDDDGEAADLRRGSRVDGVRHGGGEKDRPWGGAEAVSILALVLGVVNSAPFQMRAKASEPPARVASRRALAAGVRRRVGRGFSPAW
jgi:hypothetical protein